MGKVIKERNSSIELLKLIAILLIGINHVVMSIPSDYGFVIGEATCNSHVFVLTVFRHFGAIGNVIFMICSSWFLIESDKVKVNKLLGLIADIWVIGVTVLIAFLITGVFSVPLGDVVKSFFPTTFCNNWYCTCYVLIYAAHRILNMIIRGLSQKRLLVLTFVLSLLYFVYSTVSWSFWFYSHLMCFVTVYVLVGYIKLYAVNAVNSKRLNTRLLLISSALLMISITVLNVLGLRIGLLSSRTTALVKNGNPMIVLLAISLFCLFINQYFANKLINRLSGVSLMVYVLHENILVAKYLRPWIWTRILSVFGSELVVVHALIYTVCLLGISFIIGLLYSFTLQKLVHKISDKLTDKAISLYHILETRLLKIN